MDSCTAHICVALMITRRLKIARHIFSRSSDMHTKTQVCVCVNNILSQMHKTSVEQRRQCAGEELWHPFYLAHDTESTLSGCKSERFVLLPLQSA